jgi:ethanolamine ammonia-lyase large subunit
MGVPCADDVMLNYQSTSYHDGAAIRRLLGLRAAPEFLTWLESRGIYRDGQLALSEAIVQPLLRDMTAALNHAAISGAVAP